MAYETEKELAVNLLKVFGYTGVTKKNVTLLELSSNGTSTSYILVGFKGKEISFNGDYNTWVVEEL